MTQFFNVRISYLLMFCSVIIGTFSHLLQAKAGEPDMGKSASSSFRKQWEQMTREQKADALTKMKATTNAFGQLLDDPDFREFAKVDRRDNATNGYDNVTRILKPITTVMLDPQRRFLLNADPNFICAISDPVKKPRTIYAISKDFSQVQLHLPAPWTPWGMVESPSSENTLIRGGYASRKKGWLDFSGDGTQSALFSINKDGTTDLLLKLPKIGDKDDLAELVVGVEEIESYDYWERSFAGPVVTAFHKIGWFEKIELGRKGPPIYTTTSNYLFRMVDRKGNELCNIPGKKGSNISATGNKKWLFAAPGNQRDSICFFSLAGETHEIANIGWRIFPVSKPAGPDFFSDDFIAFAHRKQKSLPVFDMRGEKPAVGCRIPVLRPPKCREGRYDDIVAPLVVGNMLFVMHRGGDLLRAYELEPEKGSEPASETDFDLPPLLQLSTDNYREVWNTRIRCGENFRKWALGYYQGNIVVAGMSNIFFVDSKTGLVNYRFCTEKECGKYIVPSSDWKLKKEGKLDVILDWAVFDGYLFASVFTRPSPIYVWKIPEIKPRISFSSKKK